MASSVIHMCVANEVNKKLKRNNDRILIGSIAPDIAKLLGKTKSESHFLDNTYDIPNIEEFLKKYKKDLRDDFVLGYYIHLYTDYLWFKYFLPDFLENGKIYLLDGQVAKISSEQLTEYFYNDYTNLNLILINNYNLDLKIFNAKVPKLKNIITEIPMNQIQMIIDRANTIIKNSREEKAYVFDLGIVKKFINTSVAVILSNLEDIEYIKN